MMSQLDKKNHILSLLRWELKQSREHYIDAVAVHAATRAKKELTDEANEKADFGGGFGPSNPHDEALKRAEVSMESWKKNLERHEEGLEYATNIFLT